MEGKKSWKIKLPENIPKSLLRKDRLLIILLAGILLVVVAWPINSGGSQDKTGETQPTSRADAPNTSDYTQYTERKLEEVLSHVEGVGEVTAMVTLKTSAEKIIEKDRETSDETVREEDSQGGSRTTTNQSAGETTIYGSSSSGGQEGGEPWVTKELSPVVEGVVVIATGGDNAVTVQNITEAVQALFNIDTHKIRVMKRNQN